MWCDQFVSEGKWITIKGGEFQRPKSPSAFGGLHDSVVGVWPWWWGKKREREKRVSSSIREKEKVTEVKWSEGEGARLHYLYNALYGVSSSINLQRPTLMLHPFDAGKVLGEGLLIFFINNFYSILNFKKKIFYLFEFDYVDFKR